MSDSLRPHGLWPTRLLSPWNFPGKSTGVGCHFLLQGIFPTQELNPGLPHCRQTLYHLSHQGSPIPKKGNTKECSNYHTIALISHASKVMLKILQTRLQQYVNRVHAQSCPTLCDPMDCIPSGSSVHGILQTRILEWIAMCSSRGSSCPRD